MQKNGKRLVQLLLLLTVIIGGSLLIRLSSLPQNAAGPLAKVVTSSPLKITLADSTLTSILVKQQNDWLITMHNEQFPADSARVEELLSTLAKLRPNTPVSTNKNNHPAYGIGSKKIVLSSGAQQTTIFIGTTATNGTDTYYRLNDDNEIYTAPVLGDLFTSADFRNLKMGFVTDESRVTKVTQTNPSGSFTLEKTGNNWRLNTQVVPQERLDYYINDLATLTGKSVYKLPQISPKLTNEVLTIIATQNGSDRILNIYQDADNPDLYYGQVKNQPLVYELAAATVLSITKESKDFTE